MDTSLSAHCVLLLPRDLRRARLLEAEADGPLTVAGRWEEERDRSEQRILTSLCARVEVELRHVTAADPITSTALLIRRRKNGFVRPSPRLGRNEVGVLDTIF